MQNKTHSMDDLISLRAHHGMCLAFFRGEGYSSDFTRHMAQVHEYLRQNPQQKIRVVEERDIICRACPNLHGGVCETAEKVARYDRKVKQLCGLEAGNRERGRDTDREKPEGVCMDTSEDERAKGKSDEAVGPGAGNEGSINRELTWEEFEHLVRVKILDAGRREEICADCRWNELCR